jgi:hypothetical protein
LRFFPFPLEEPFAWQSQLILACCCKPKTRTHAAGYSREQMGFQADAPDAGFCF